MKKRLEIILLALIFEFSIYAQTDSNQKIEYSKEQLALKITTQDIRLISNDGEDGYHLYIRKKPGINSVLLTETTRDPDGKITNYAYRASEYNKINGDEIRYLDGKPLTSEGAKYSLIDSTVEKTSFFEEAFHIFIPKTLKYGYSWSRNGQVEVGKGTFINIRTFELPYADYSGAFLDNPFMFSFETRKKEKVLNLQDNYNPEANITFRELSPVVVYSKGPETIIQDILEVLKEIKNKDNCDIVFAIDATGSMKDDIEEVRKNLVPLLKDEFKNAKNARFGLLFYRDYGDTFSYKNLPVKFFDFTADENLFIKNLNSIKIIGIEGGDIPEAVYEAIYACSEFYSWGENNDRHIILIGDAPAHPTPKGSKEYTKDFVTKKAAEKGIKIHTILLPFDK